VLYRHLIQGNHLMKLVLGLAVTAWVLAASPVGIGAGPVREEMRWHGWVPGGQVVEINNVLGDVRAEEATGDEVEVIALKHGSDDPAHVSIEVVEHKGGVTICAVYPNLSPDHPFECRPSRGGGFREAAASESEAHIRWDNGGGGDVALSDLSVDFVVRLPKRLRFIGRTVDGEVSASVADQDVEAHSVRGDVSVEMNSAGADIRAETARGEVCSEFPLLIRGDSTRGTYATGHIGHAHRIVRLKSGTGNIRVQRTPQIF
jgi:hypothetical protein